MGSPLLRMRKPKLQAFKLKSTPRQGTTEPGPAPRALEGRTCTQGSGFHGKESRRLTLPGQGGRPRGTGLGVHSSLSL